MLFYISCWCKIIANGNFEHTLSEWVSIDECKRKRVLESTRNLWILLLNLFTEKSLTNLCNTYSLSTKEQYHLFYSAAKNNMFILLEVFGEQHQRMWASCHIPCAVPKTKFCVFGLLFKKLVTVGISSPLTRKWYNPKN